MNVVARRTDPSTSWEAARSVSQVRERQLAVFWLLRRYGPMTDEQIADLYAPPLPHQSPSGLRTRRCELVHKGWVVDTEQRKKMRSGREAIVWRAKTPEED